MRKNRNSFFTETNSFETGMMPIPPTMPYQAGTSYNSFYTGPNMGINNHSDIETRLAKIERQINRLDHRISKLEGTTNNTYVENYDTTDNMYML